MTEPTLAPNINHISTPHSSNYNKPSIGKVIAVILGEDNVLGVKNKETAKKIYKENGAYAGIGIIYYLPSSHSGDVSALSFTDFTKIAKAAKPLSANLRHFPLLGEFVELHNYSANNTITEQTVYYSAPINTWNDPQHNSTSPQSDVISYIRPLKLNQGDISFEGRYGNSVRFSKLGTIINNGQYDTKTLDHVEEVVKGGSSTIWMTRNHKFDFKVDSYNYLSKEHTKPDAIGNFLGDQIVVESDRVNILSHSDDVIVYSRRSTEIYAEKILTLNSGAYTHINSDNIYLGKNLDKQAPSQAAVRGYDLVFALTKLCEKIGDFAQALKLSYNGPEGTEILNITAAANLLQEDIKGILENDIEPILSEQVFIE